jgi:ATPase subunit of ABC transporter with duplicated ATPase domains
MISVNNVTLRFGKKTLFENVNLKFTNGNCYGLIGANGAGKTTFLKLLSGELETSSGEITIGKDERLAVLEQDHYKYDNYSVIDVVLMGNKKLYDIKIEKEELYNHTEFTDQDGIRLGELEAEFAEMNGWGAESEAGELLSSLGIPVAEHYNLLSEIEDSHKVKVLLAKALFQNPDILLLDEPTNNLDLAAIEWLEEFLINYENTVIVVSHDRYFLNKVCTHIVDIDYNKMTLFMGNYDFWYESSQLLIKQIKEQNKKKEEKIKELESFIARFSANASKSKQATSRKKILEKIKLEELVPSTRRYPYIDFKPEKPSGREVLTIKDLVYEENGNRILNKVNIIVNKGDKIAFVGRNNIAKTALFNIIMHKLKYSKGEVLFGKTINPSYFPIDNTEYFKSDKDIMEWLQSEVNIPDPQELRNFLGRMLFSNEDVFKKVNVLSGGEKARVLLSKMMLENPNFIVLDEPTNHLDLESITSLNKGLSNFEGEILLASHDHELISTVANRIIEIKEDGTIIDKISDYDSYLEWRKTFY